MKLTLRSNSNRITKRQDENLFLFYWFRLPCQLRRYFYMILQFFNQKGQFLRIPAQACEALAGEVALLMKQQKPAAETVTGTV